MERSSSRGIPSVRSHGGIEAKKISLEIRDAEQVDGEREESVELLLRAFLLDEESNLAADRREHRQQVFVGLANLAAEEFHHPDRLGTADDRKPEGGVQPDVIGERRAWKIRVPGDVWNPRWRQARPDAPW